MDATEKKKWKRYALEGYVGKKDEWYFSRVRRELKEKEKKETTLVVASAVVTIIFSVTLNYCLLDKFLKQYRTQI